MEFLQGVIQILGVNNHDDILIRKEHFLSEVNALYQNGYRVADISWWKHKKITDSAFDSITGGGVKDDANPDFYWAETIFCKNFANCADINDITSYYTDCISDCTFDDLTPSISIIK